MKNYKSLITSSLLLALIIATPIASFAEGNDKDKEDRNEKKFKIEQVQKDKEDDEDKKERGNSFNRGFANWFNKRINAKANVEVNLAPSIEGITAPTVLKVGEVGTWIVKASDPKNTSLSYAVDWGDNNIVSKSLSLLSQQVFVQTGTFTHTYADKGEYRVMFTVSNEAGLKTVSSVTVHVRDTEDVVAPVISNLNVTNVKSHKATINWTTDTKSNTMVWISKTSPVDTNLAKYSRKALVLNHKMELKKLEANTKYYVVVGSKNKAGITKSAEMSFTTLVSNPDITPTPTPTPTPDTTAPVISAITTNVTGINAVVSWTTNEPATSNVFYSTGTPVDTNAILTPKVTDGALTTSHSLSIPSLTSSTLYHFVIKSLDASNNVVLSSESTFATN